MLFFSMLPIYLFGNLHCIGMCGPLVMMIGKHRFRALYFLGRTVSFSLVGLLAGGMGSVLNVLLQEYYISAITCFLFGFFILWIGLMQVFALSVPIPVWIANRATSINKPLSILMLKDQPLATFLFGFFTVALPCGQTLIVYSACAIHGEWIAGMVNGLLFALLTSPSLFLAMNAHKLLKQAKRHYSLFMGSAALIAGTLALFRGFAELDIIPHLVLNPGSLKIYHLVIY